MRKILPIFMFAFLVGILLPSDDQFAGIKKLRSRQYSQAAAGTAGAFDHTLIFPQTANGSSAGTGSRSSVLLMNNTGRSASGVLLFYDDSGAPWTLRTNLGAGNSFDFALEAGQVLRVDTDGAGALKSGWARVDSDAELSGTGTFVVSNGDGSFLSEVGIGDSAPSSRQMIFVENGQGKYTGVAVCNPDSVKAASIVFELRSLDGSSLQKKSIALGPLAHLSEFASQTFPQIATQDFSGILEVSSDVPVSLVTLRSDGIRYTSMPSVPEPPSGQAGPDLIFPRVGDGLFGTTRFRTAFLLINNSDAGRTATLDLFNGDGTPMTVTIGSTSSSRFTTTVPARGAAQLITAGQSDRGALGWARIASDGAVGGAAVFSTFEKDSGFPVSEIGVPGTQAEARCLLYVREKDGGLTGLALSNATADGLTARLRLYPGLGTAAAPGSSATAVVPRAEKTLDIPAHSGRGQFIFELFPDVPEIAANGFEGRLEITTWVSRFGEDILAPSSALTLLFRGSKYTSLPTAPYRPDTRPLSAFDARANELLAQMTLDEKIGQMTQAERGSLNDGDIQNYYLGSVLSGGGSGPNVNSVEAWASMYDGFQSQALKTRLKIPILYGIDAVHGHNNVRGAVVFPHNIGLGATRDSDLVRMAARVTAAEVRATGMNWTFSPVVAVPQDERWGRTYEGFGEDPELVRPMGLAAVLGFQGTSLADPSSIVACAKHYLGDGGTTWGTGSPIDQGDTRVDEATLRRVHLPGYLGAMQAGTGTIMVSFSSWNGQKMTGNRYLLTEVLKGDSKASSSRIGPPSTNCLTAGTAIR